tara:strand:- start:275 stop:451 length:177 start_codon:yes stop_codon:yes gene_type:complete
MVSDQFSDQRVLAIRSGYVATNRVTRLAAFAKWEKDMSTAVKQRTLLGGQEEIKEEGY